MPITPLNTLLAIPEIAFGVSANPTFASPINMSSTAIWTGAIIPIPKTGSIRKIWINLFSSNVGNIYSVRLESVDASGRPSGTLWGTGTEATGLTGYAAGGIIEATLGSNASVTAGDLIAVMVRPTTYVGTSALAGYMDGGPSGSSIPGIISTSDSGGTYAFRSYAPTMALEYSDGSFANIAGLFPVRAANTTTLTATSNPRMAGNKITPAVGLRAVGMWFWSDNDANVRLRLYGPDGTTVLWTADYDGDIPITSSAAFSFTLYFPTPIELAAGQTYYLMAEALATSVGLYDFQTFNAATLSALNAGAIASRVTCANNSPTGPGSFTADTDKQATCGLIFDGIDIPAASGGETSHTFVG